MGGGRGRREARQGGVMIRRVALGVLILAALAGCARSRTPVPTGPATAATTPGAASAFPTADPTGRLPRILAEVSLALPGGDVYQPQAAGWTDSGQCVVLGIGHPGLGVEVPRLLLLDLASGARGPAYDLPGRSATGLAVGGTRAFVAYEDEAYRTHLAAVDLGTGRILADLPVEYMLSEATLAAGPTGPLYCQTPDRVEARDPATLEVVRSVAYSAGPGLRRLVLDAAHGRLFVAAGSLILAYRTPDLSLLWEAPLPQGQLTHLAADRSGRQLLVRWENYVVDQTIVGLLALDAETGRPIGAPRAPEGMAWDLVGADCDAGYLYFASPGGDTRLWQARFDGVPTGVQTTLAGYARLGLDPQGRLLAVLGDTHELIALDPATLEVAARGITGIEIRHLVVDAAHERAYLNDSAGRVHVLDTRDYTLRASLPAGTGEPIGTGPLTLDPENGLLFVARRDRIWGGAASHDEIAVLRVDPLAVAGVMTGGNCVAVDSAGHRAFVGWRAQGPADPPGEVQVWDTRTFRRLGTIPQRGAPAYNPLRDEVYLCDYSVHIVDGKTLQVTGDLTPDIAGQPVPWCSGCLRAESVSVDPAQDLVVVDLTLLSTGGGPGPLPEPRTFSARTLQPVTHTATILGAGTGGELVICPASDGIVYESRRYARYVLFESVVAYPVGSAEPLSYPEGLGLDLYLPGKDVALSFLRPYILAYDPRPGHWEPLGWIPYQPIGAVDLAGRRLYAWEGARLRVLSFDGGQPLPPVRPRPWPESEPLGSIEEIHPSPAFARDRTVFVVAAGHILRSTDGGATWVALQGLPSAVWWTVPSYHLALSPDFEHDRTLFVGGNAGASTGLGVWRSQDAGDTWQPVWQGLEHLRIDRLAISPRFAQDRMLLAYASYNLFWRGESGWSVFRSENGGAAWTLAARVDAARGGTLPEPEELLPAADSVRFRLGGYGLLLRSGDGGASWQPVLRLARPGRILIARSPDFARDGEVYAADPYTLYRSTDGGLSWQMATDLGEARSDPTSELTALAVTRGGDGQPVVFVGVSSPGEGTGSVVALEANRLTWSPAPVPEPTPAPSPSPTACPSGLERLGPWQQEQLGCPVSAPREVPMAWQGFERGQMFWQGERREIIVLYSDMEANRWLSFPDTWQEGQPDRDPALQPPPDREQPIRGFGRVWREELGGPGATVGWAVQGEQGYTGRWQAFERGQVISAPDGALYALLADGTWVSE